MAKKPTKSDKPSINFSVDFNSKIQVTPKAATSFKRDLDRGELSLSLAYYVNGAMSGCSAYSDSISGGIKFEHLSDGVYLVSANGTFSTKDSFGKLPDIIKAGDVDLILEFVSDSDANEHFIEGDSSKTVIIGKFVP
jgi:hypothetical protein